MKTPDNRRPPPPNEGEPDEIDIAAAGFAVRTTKLLLVALLISVTWGFVFDHFFGTTPVMIIVLTVVGQALAIRKALGLLDLKIKDARDGDSGGKPPPDLEAD